MNNYLCYIIGFHIANRTYFKVGVTKNLNVRISQLQTGSPFEIQCYELIHLQSKIKTFKLEKLIHITWKKYHYKNKWFLTCNLPFLLNKYKEKFNINILNYKKSINLKPDNYIKELKKIVNNNTKINKVLTNKKLFPEQLIKGLILLNKNHKRFLEKRIKYFKG